MWLAVVFASLLASVGPARAATRRTSGASIRADRSPSLKLATASGLGFEQVGGDLCATWTPQLQLRGEGVELQLAPTLRMVASSSRGDYGLRDRDWDERSEWLRPLRRLLLRSSGGGASLELTGDLGLTLGHGALVDGARAGLLPDSYRAALHARLAQGPLQLEVYGDDVTRFGVFATRLGVQPLGDRHGAPASGLGSWTLALESVADRDAPIAVQDASGATIGSRAAPRVAGLVESSWTLLSGPTLALRTFVGAGVVSHDERTGWGLDGGLLLALRDARRPQPWLQLLVAPVYGSGVWLPGGVDAGYQLERRDLAHEPLSARLARVAAAGGVGVGVRSSVQWTPLPSLSLRAETRLLPQADRAADGMTTDGRHLDGDLSAWSLAGRWQQGDWAANAGWLRRPGGLHLVAIGGGVQLLPWLRSDLRVERAMHQARGGPMQPQWDVGLTLTASLPAPTGSAGTGANDG